MFTEYQALAHMGGSADKSQRGRRALSDELLPGFAGAGGGAELDYLGHATNYALTAEAVCTLPHTIGRRSRPKTLQPKGYRGLSRRHVGQRTYA